MLQYPWVFQQRDFFIQWCPGQKFLIGSWTGLSLQLWRARAEKERERERCGLRKAEKIFTPKCAGQINGVNEAKCMKLGPAHRDLQLPCSYFLPRYFLNSSFPPNPSLNMNSSIHPCFKPFVLSTFIFHSWLSLAVNKGLATVAYGQWWMVQSHLWRYKIPTRK